jgi:hypothetical protein
MISANTYIGARVMLRAPLTDNDAAGLGSLTAKYLYT